MLFIDPFFLLVFLPAALTVFYLAGRRRGGDAALAVLFAASCLFYLAWGWKAFAVMAVGTVVNYAACMVLLRLPDEARGARLGAFWTGQAYNLISLLLFKYLAGDIAGLSGVVPVGISFYTFQQAVLLVDALNRQPEVRAYLPAGEGPRSFLRFGAFHTFFPQLVVGPITYLSEFGPQALRERFGRFKRIDLEVGATLLVIGLFKKVVIADQLARFTDPLFVRFAQGAEVSAGQAWLAVTGFFVQLYFDFSGYSDMALGAARMFGVRLPINFDSPLRASGIADFYRRWHITLTRIVQRFLFTPIALEGARRTIRGGPMAKRLASLWLPAMINFQVIALWHAALSTFVLFGLIHGAWFLLETEVRTSKPWRAFRKRTSEAQRRRLGQALTLLPLMLTFALFRSADLDAFGRLLAALVPIGGFGPTDRWGFGFVAAAFAIVWLAPNAYELTRRYRPGLWSWRNDPTTPAPFQLAWRPTLRWGIVLAALSLIAVWGLSRSAPFIYQGF